MATADNDRTDGNVAPPPPLDAQGVASRIGSSALSSLLLTHSCGPPSAVEVGPNWW